MTPRVFRMYAGDIFTTNNVAKAEYELGDKLVPGADGILAKGQGEGLTCQVIKLTTMPDGQPGLKLQVIAE